MDSIIDRLLLFGGCFLFIIMKPITTISIVTSLIALSFCAMNLVFDSRRLKLGLGLIYSVLCFIQPEFCVFLPLILYDAFWNQEYVWMAINGVLLINFVREEHQLLFLLILTGISYAFMYKTKQGIRLNEEYKKLRDTSKELNLLLENRNQELIEKQDSEIRLATLRERNRIAREIHDNVGHLLSRTILMVGAMAAMNKDENLNEVLEGVKTTLSSAMNSIRESVHDLHDESFDLDVEIKKLIANFQFCQVEYEYDMHSVADHNVKYSFLTIVKEALANVMKHSNATKVSILVREHPGIYQLLIEDNGTNGGKGAINPQKERQEGGIGLENMKERIDMLKGTISIRNENGYRIFISVPKEKRAP